MAINTLRLMSKSPVSNILTIIAYSQINVELGLGAPIGENNELV